MARERLRIAMPDHSIEAHVKAADVTLDGILEETRPQRAIAEANPDGPRELAKKAPSEPVQWKWRDETQVARELAGYDGTGRVAFAGEHVGLIERTQAFGRQLDRARDHVGGGSGGSRSYDPSSYGTAHRAAATGVWCTLTAGERSVLSAMYGDLVSRDDGGPRSVAAKVREFMRAEAEASARALLGPETRWQGLDLATVTPTQLAAIKLRRLGADADGETKGRVTGELSLELRAARRVFRDRLRQVDVNEHLGRLQSADGIPRDRRPFLIPPAMLEELEAQRAREERVCIGPIDLEPLDPSVDVLLAIAAGDRPHCGSGLVVADVSSWPRCDACRLPMQPVGRTAS